MGNFKYIYVFYRVVYTFMHCKMCGAKMESFFLSRYWPFFDLFLLTYVKVKVCSTYYTQFLESIPLLDDSFIHSTYSVTHMDSYRSKWVFWALFKGLETCPSRFIMGLTVNFIFWKNVQTKWIFKFWPYFQKIPMQKYKKLENWRSNFPNFIPDIKMYALCDNRNVFENSL